MRTGTTKSGFHYEYDEEIADDMEFVELLIEVEQKPHMLPKAIEWLLGSEQKKALYDHNRNDKGRVPVGKVAKEFEEIMSGEPELKNSEPSPA